MRDVRHERRRATLNQLLRESTIAWHGVKLGRPDWSSYSHALAFGAALPNDELIFHVILNAFWEPLDFELPKVANGGIWRRWIDTTLDSPQDIVEWQSAHPVSSDVYRAGPRSVVMLASGTAFDKPRLSQNRKDQFC